MMVVNLILLLASGMDGSCSSQVSTDSVTFLSVLNPKKVLVESISSGVRKSVVVELPGTSFDGSDKRLRIGAMQFVRQEIERWQLQLHVLKRLPTKVLGQILYNRHLKIHENEHGRLVEEYSVRDLTVQLLEQGFLKCEPDSPYVTNAMTRAQAKAKSSGEGLWRRSARD